MAASETNPHALALQALVWTLADSLRANRLLDLTGLNPDELRARISDPSLLAATLGFLEAYEPDLIACAEALDVKPAALVSARTELENA